MLKTPIRIEEAYLETDTFAFIASALVLPYNIGLLFVLVTTSCRLGIHVGIVDDNYRSKVGLGFTIGLGIVAYGVVVDMFNYLA